MVPSQPSIGRMHQRLPAHIDDPGRASIRCPSAEAPAVGSDESKPSSRLSATSRAWNASAVFRLATRGYDTVGLYILYGGWIILRLWQLDGWSSSSRCH